MNPKNMNEVILSNDDAIDEGLMAIQNDKYNNM